MAPRSPDSIEAFDPTVPPPDSGPCPFCNIASTYDTYDPMSPPRSTIENSPSLSSSFSPSAKPAATAPPAEQEDPSQPHPHLLDPNKLSPSSFIVLSTPLTLAFLDIMPLSRGHLLLCPRRHRPKLTDVTEEEAADLGRWLRVLSRALVRATGVGDWNVVQNNGAAAAQVVGHVHYHLIPRPEIRASGRFRESFTMFGRGQREELDDEEAEELAERIRGCVGEVLVEGEKERLKQRAMKEKL